MTTIAGPTTPTSFGPETEGKTSPSSQGERGITWQQVLGTGRAPKEQLASILRGSEREGAKETTVSKEAIEVAKSSLIRALVLNSERGQGEYQTAFFYSGSSDSS